MMALGSELAGRHVLVTGASRGIGRVIAIHLASHGAPVSVHGRDTGRWRLCARRSRPTAVPAMRLSVT